MPERETRSVVITGASRGLGLSASALLYRRGWRVVGAMRSPGTGLENLRAATGAKPGDPRLIGVRLDLSDPASIAAAAKEIEEVVGAPYGLVHNAGIAAAGCVEDVSPDVWEELFATNLFGPVELTRALLPSMRAAGRGRIVVVSSQGGVRGMPGISAYSASKGALERFGESLAGEIAPFGLGVSIFVTGAFKTDILTDERADHRNYDGPYGEHYAGIDRTGAFVVAHASPPERFARALARALDERVPLTRRGVGIDARLMLAMMRLLPAGIVDRVIRLAMQLPRPGSLGKAKR